MVSFNKKKELVMKISGSGIFCFIVGIILAFIACITIYEGIDRGFIESIFGGLFGVMASIFVCTGLILSKRDN